MRKSMIFVLVLLLAGTASAAQNLWTGPSGGSYNTASNWSLGAVPDTDSAVMRNGTTAVMDTYYSGGTGGMYINANTTLNVTGHFYHPTGGWTQVGCDWDNTPPVGGGVLNVDGGTYEGIYVQASQLMGGTINVINGGIMEINLDGRYAWGSGLILSENGWGSELSDAAGTVNIWGGVIATDDFIGSWYSDDVLSLDGSGALYYVNDTSTQTVAGLIASGIIRNKDGSTPIVDVAQYTDIHGNTGWYNRISVPEPMTIALLALGGLLLRRRKNA